MKAAQRIAVDSMAEVLDAAGVAWRTTNGGKHLCVIVTAPDGHEHKMPVSGSPRDRDAAANMQRQQAQRLVESFGIGERRGQVAARKARHHRRYQPDRLVIVMRDRDNPDPDEGPLRDPWAALAGLKVAEAVPVAPVAAEPVAAPPCFWRRALTFVHHAFRAATHRGE